MVGIVAILEAKVFLVGRLLFVVLRRKLICYCWKSTTTMIVDCPSCLCFVFFGKSRSSWTEAYFAIVGKISKIMMIICRLCLLLVRSNFFSWPRNKVGRDEGIYIQGIRIQTELKFQLSDAFIVEPGWENVNYLGRLTPFWVRAKRELGKRWYLR